MNVFQATVFHDGHPLMYKIIHAKTEARARKKFSRIFKRNKLYVSTSVEVFFELI